MAYFSEQETWFRRAEADRPVLHERVVRPAAAVEIRAAAASFQGWEAAPRGVFPDVLSLAPGESVVADFGGHGVGKIAFDLATPGAFNDAPARLLVSPAEVPLELGVPMPETARLAQGWRQEALLHVDRLPTAIVLERRYAFRYVRIAWDERRANFGLTLSNLRATWSSSAPWDDPAPPVADAGEAALWRMAGRTLRDCMHTVFEDGPKRDRRLWLGDLRLQALANETLFRVFPPVRRCLYLLAGACREDGLVPGCVYETDPPVAGNFVIDYAALFGPTLADYARASGDLETARALLPVAVRQYAWLRERMDAQARLTGKEWAFIDWKPGLDTDAPLAGVVLYGLAETARLARDLGEAETAASLEDHYADLRGAARRAYVDADGAVHSHAGQRSRAAWAWAALSGLLVPEEAAADWIRLDRDPGTVPAGTPYLMHHVVHALHVAGLEDVARQTLNAYWGGMRDAGLTTFPEAWDPADPLFSPYNAAQMNSYCHAWSCTVPWLLRLLGT